MKSPRQFLLLSVAVALMVCAVPALSTTINVKLKNVGSDRGTVRVVLVNKEQFLLRRKLKKPFKVAIAPAKKGAMTFKYEDIPPGDYALQATHDENDNGVFDVNFLGLPKEKWGISRDPKFRLQPPKWEDAKFTVSTDDKEIDIEFSLR